MFLRITLLVYFTIFFAVAFVLKSIMVAKRIGKNEVVRFRFAVYLQV